MSQPLEHRGLQALFAANGRSAIVVRRGPSQHHHLIHWDLETDAFRRGQWMRGRVRVEDLSANGRWLLYWAGQYHRAVAPRLLEKLGSDTARDRQLKRIRRGHKVPRYQAAGLQSLLQTPRPEAPLTTWTAISRAPFFTALALWPTLGTWTGGGGFADDGALVLREWSGTPTILNADAEPPFALRMIGRSDDFPRSARRAGIADDAFAADLAASLAANGGKGLHWIDDDPRHGLTFACDRRIYRATRGEAVLRRPFEAARLVGDFAELKFELVPPPADALVW